MNDASAANQLAMPRWAIRLAVVAVAAALVAWQAASVWPFFSDDSFILLRYVQRLLAGEGLTWTAGERVEGYSNLLWLLLCAGVGALGVDLVVAARLLGALCVGAALWLLSARPWTSWRDLPAMAVGPLTAAASAPVAVWMLGGLEGGLHLLLLVAGQLAFARVLAADPPSRRALLAAGLPFALLFLVRPESPMWVVALGGVLLASTRSLRAVLTFASLPVAAGIMLLAFNQLYYAEWLPNTAFTKVGVSAVSVPAGALYVVQGLRVLRGVVVLAVLGAVLMLRQKDARRRAASLVVPLLLWFLYLTVIGGDHFVGWRLLLPALPMLVILAVEAMAALRAHAGVAAFLALAATVGLLRDTRTDARTVAAAHETWEVDGQIVGSALRLAFGAQQPLLAVEAAGAVPYFSQLPCLDLLGLCDWQIARTPVSATAVRLAQLIERRDFVPGHMHGNGDYVMQRAPDLLLYASPFTPLPLFSSGVEYGGDRRFLDGYRCIVLAADATRRAGVWVRTDRFVQTDVGGGVRLPGFLLGSLRLQEPLVPPGLAPGPSSWQRTADWWLRPAPDVGVVADAVGGAHGLLIAAAADFEALPLAGRVRVAVEPAGVVGVSLWRADGSEVARDGDVSVVGERQLVTVRASRPTGSGPVRIDAVVFTPVR